MMTKPLSWATLALLLVCSTALAQAEVPRVERVLTQEEQDALTPDQVLSALKQGNQRFVSGTVTSRDHSAQVRDAANGQFPKAMVLSCVDSRIPVEDVFDRGIGDVFVARVAGNFENTDILGSMEFATKISGAKLVLVLGHGSCGAIKAAIDDAQLGNITAMLENIKPAVESQAGYKGEHSSNNAEFVHLVTEANVRLTMDDIRERSPIMHDLEKQGRLKIVGGLYDMHTGKIEFLD
jgi:carbonic anhydrase